MGGMEKIKEIWGVGDFETRGNISGNALTFEDFLKFLQPLFYSAFRLQVRS